LALLDCGGYDSRGAASPADDPHAEHRHVFAISAERALCRDVEVNVAYPWLCALSIEDTIPDHSA
jgi:hypothetical protein